MTTSNLPYREYLSAPIPEQAFDYRTPEELLFDVQLTANQSGLEIPELSYQLQSDFGHIVHNVLNKHFQAQHKSEWESGIANAIAPPLPHQWVSSRLDIYYKKALKGDSDKVHQNNIRADRKKFLPVAVEMANALPEINAAIDIQILLDDSGHEIAADSISDLLVVYGTTIHFLREKQAKLKQEKQAKANRAAQAIISAELLQ